MRLARNKDGVRPNLPLRKEQRIDVLCFEGVESASADRAINELNQVWNQDRDLLRFVRRTETPSLGKLRPDEWLSEEFLSVRLRDLREPDALLISITPQRLAQDYFACHFPDDGTAILTTYNNPSIPAEILEYKYLEFSLVYCFLDLIGKLSTWHVETRGCLFDDVPQPTDIGVGLRHWSICDPCLKRMAEKVLEQPELKAIFAGAKRVLDELGPRESESPPLVAKASPPIPAPVKITAASSHRGASTTPYNLSGQYLTVDRNLMINEIKRRWGIQLDHSFADKPRQIAKTLQSITSKIFKHHPAWTFLSSLVKVNHTTDGLHFDIPGKRHRDHTLHQLYVALLGMIFLDMEVPILQTNNGTRIENRTLRKIISDSLHVAPAEVDVAWYISAILHDHCYPLSDAISRIKRMIRARGTIGNQEILASRLRLDISGLRGLMAPPLMKVIPGYVTKGKWPLTTDPEGFERDYQNALTHGLNSAVDVSQLDKQMPRLRYDHGVIGAANIGLFAQDVDFIRRHVCRAIYDHNLKNDITFEEWPLSFLLKLCDTLQEWDRIVYTSDGEVVRESKAVKLGPFRRRHDTLVWAQPLHPKFHFEREDRLELTDWKAALWEEGTREHLGLLKHQHEVFVEVQRFSISYERVIRH